MGIRVVFNVSFSLGERLSLRFHFNITFVRNIGGGMFILPRKRRGLGGGRGELMVSFVLGLIFTKI